ncbi:hypothetical protein, partial [Streptomyces stramineus]
PPVPGPPGAQPPRPPVPGPPGGQMYAPPPPPPQGPQGPQGPRRNNKTMLAVIGGVVALAVIGGGAFFFLKGGDDEKPDEAKKPAESGAPAQGGTGDKGGEPAGEGGASAPALPADGQPMIAGWQNQKQPQHFFQYDVPGKGDKWQTLPRETAISYTEGGKPVVVMTGTSNYREGGCASKANPDSIGEAGKGQLATVGTTGGGTDLTIQQNAINWAGNWAVMAYGGTGANKPKIEMSKATPWKANGIDGYTATAKVTVKNRPSPCVPPTAIVKSIAQKMPDGTYHGWVIYADQGVPDALSVDQIDKIMKTVRPAKG